MFLITSKSSSSLVLDSSESTDFLETFDEFAVLLVDGSDKHIVVFKDKETSARTNCQNENKPSNLKCSSQVQSAAVVDTDNDKTTESS
jgi:hypothetical protein